MDETLLQQWKSYDSLHFDKTSFFKHGSWAKSGDAMQNAFKVHLRENSHRHISTNQASNWTGGQCGIHQEWGKLPGYFVIYNSGRLKQIIILFLEGSSSRPALLFVPIRHSTTTSLIVLKLFLYREPDMLESIFCRKGKCFHIIPAFKKQGNMEYKIILSKWYGSWQRLNLFENIWLKNVAGKEDRRGDWCWIIRLG